MKKFLIILVALAFCANADAAETQYMKFTNDHAEPSFVFEIPNIFGSVRIPGMGDSLDFESENGEYVLMICDGKDLAKEFGLKKVDGQSVLKATIDRIYGSLVPNSAKSGGGFFTFDQITDGPRDDVDYIYHQYGIVDSKSKAIFFYVLTYPKEEEARFAKIKERMDASLKLAD